MCGCGGWQSDLAVVWSDDGCGCGGWMWRVFFFFSQLLFVVAVDLASG